MRATNDTNARDDTRQSHHAHQNNRRRRRRQQHEESSISATPSIQPSVTMISPDMGRQLVLNVARNAMSNALVSALQQHQGQAPTDMPYDDDFYDGTTRGSNDETFVIGFIPWLKRVLYATIVTTSLLLLSMGTYGCFYVLVMPTSLSITKPVFFDYTCCNGDADATGIAGTICQNGTKGQTQETKERRIYSLGNDRHSKTMISPTAKIDLFAKHTQWQAFNDEVIPKPGTPTSSRSKDNNGTVVQTDHMLKPAQSYFIEIALVLPETQVNTHVGMFTVHVDLHSSSRSTSSNVSNNNINAGKSFAIDNMLLARSIRSTRIPYESNWISIIRKTILIIPLLFGGILESKTVIIPSFNHYVESVNYPLQYITVRLVMPPQAEPQRQNKAHSQMTSSSSSTTQNIVNEESSSPSSSHQQQHNNVIEVISGEVRIGKELNKFQDILRKWFYTCYTIGSIICFIFYAFIFLVIQTWIEEQQRQYQYLNDEEGDLFGDSPYGGDFFDDDDNGDDDNNSNEWEPCQNTTGAETDGAIEEGEEQQQQPHHQQQQEREDGSEEEEPHLVAEESSGLPTQQSEQVEDTATTTDNDKIQTHTGTVSNNNSDDTQPSSFEADNQQPNIAAKSENN